MQLCSNYHEEVAYESLTCPVCALTKEYDDNIVALEDEVYDLKKVVNALTDIVKKHTPEELI